jgi:hypothetical protein
MWGEQLGFDQVLNLASQNDEDNQIAVSIFENHFLGFFSK